VTVSIDPSENAGAGRRKKKVYLECMVAGEKGCTFYGNNNHPQLTQAAGLLRVRSKKGACHPTGIMVVTRGANSRYFYGIISVQGLRLTGRSGREQNRFAGDNLLMCYHYDPVGPVRGHYELFVWPG
jgi:hypothetical protein